MTTLDPARALLLVIDFQARLMPAIHEGERAVRNARRLTDAAALHHVLKVVTASGHRTPDAYRTVECHTGAHRLCTKAVAPPPPAGIPVIYLACDCGCHERALGPGRGSLAS